MTKIEKYSLSELKTRLRARNEELRKELAETKNLIDKAVDKFDREAYDVLIVRHKALDRQIELNNKAIGA